VSAAKVRLWFIRHGETAWSLTGQHTGRTDLALTAHGESHAHALRGRLGETRFTHVLTSPRQRAGRTCALAAPGAGAAIEPELAEWDYGDYEGLVSADIRARWPGWDIFRDGCPHGETPAQIAGRADRLIARLDALAGDVALFSPGQFGAVLAARWIGVGVVHGENFPLGPASLSILAHSAHHPQVRAVELWNAGAPG
jgi:probable phosphoglycerate mutase